MLEIETRRLRLRPIALADLPALARMWGDADVMKYLPTGESRSVEETHIELSYMVSHWQEHGFGVWAVVLKETAAFIGYCGLQYLHVEPGGVTEEALQGGTDVEVVAGLAKPYWKQGIAPEATRAALRYGFETVRLPRVVAAIHPDNAASRHILESMGMKLDENMDYYGECPHFVIRREEFQLDDFSLDLKQEYITACYNAVAKQYAAIFFHELEHKPLDRLLLGYFHAETKNLGMVCDMGCGPGEVADYLHQLGAQVMGIDISEAMIAEARRLNPALEFRVEDMFRLSLSDNSLAGISAFYAIVNFEIDDIPLVIREFHRALQTGGLLLLTFHIGDQKVVAENFMGQDVVLEFSLFDPDAILDILRTQGFRIDSALVRYPYEDVEPQTKRAYIFARKQEGIGVNHP